MTPSEKVCYSYTHHTKWKVLSLLLALEKDLHLTVLGSTIIIYKRFCLVQIHL